MNATTLILLLARPSSSTTTLQRVGVIAIAVVVFVVVFELIRRRYLMERYALLWLGAAVVLVVLAVWRGLLTSLSADLHIYTPANSLFAAGFVFVIALLLNFSMVISRLSEHNKMLAQRLALLDERVEHIAPARPADVPPAPPSTAPPADSH
jgi:hypothetical protein